MNTQRNIAVGLLILGLIGVITAAGWSAGAQTRPAPPPSDPMLARIGLLSSPKVDRRRLADSILDLRKEHVAELIKLADPDNKEKYDWATRMTAARLLGHLRAPEAVPVLLKAMVAENENVGRRAGSDLDPYEYSSAPWASLMDIGRPSVPGAIDLLKRTDNRATRSDCVLLLGHVLGGKQGSLRLLDRLIEREKDTQVLARLRAARDYETNQVTEHEPPLY